MRIFSDTSPSAISLCVPLFFSSRSDRPINIILRNWFLSGTRRYVRCIFRTVAAERNWPDDWLVVSDRARDRTSMEPRKIDTVRAIIVPRQAFSFSTRTFESRHFFLRWTRVAYPVLRERCDLCICWKSARIILLHLWDTLNNSALLKVWKTVVDSVGNFMPIGLLAWAILFSHNILITHTHTHAQDVYSQYDQIPFIFSRDKE